MEYQCPRQQHIKEIKEKEASHVMMAHNWFNHQTDIGIFTIIFKTKETKELLIRIKEAITTQIRCFQYCVETLRAHQVEGLNKDKLHRIIVGEEVLTIIMDLDNKTVEETTSKGTATSAWTISK